METNFCEYSKKIKHLFKSHYVVWKHCNNKKIDGNDTNSLNRTM